MNVTSIVLSNKFDGIESAICTFNLSQTSYADPYIMADISGLDLDEITPKLYGNGVSGVKLFDMKPKPKNVVLKILLNPNYATGQTVSQLRDALYKTISSYRTGYVTLGFFEGITESAILDGLITKFETPLSSKDPTVQITLRCDYPFLRSRNRISVPTTGLGLLTPSITDSLSTAPHGFRFKVTITGALTFFRIQKTVDADWFFQVAPLFATGDQLFFSSEVDNKYLYMVRAGATYQLLNSVVSGSQWPLIFPGVNNFNVSTSLFTWDYVDYYTTYWGL